MKSNKKKIEKKEKEEKIFCTVFINLPGDDDTQAQNTEKKNEEK